MATAPPLTFTVSVFQADVPVDGERLRGERLVRLDEVEVGNLPAGLLERRAERRELGLSP